MEEQNMGHLPLALIKQTYLKMESAAGDLYEILEDEDLNDDEKAAFQSMKEQLIFMMANLINLIKNECGEDDFLAIQVPMEEVEPWPGDETDIMDEECE